MHLMLVCTHTGMCIFRQVYLQIHLPSPSFTHTHSLPPCTQLFSQNQGLLWAAAWPAGSCINSPALTKAGCSKVLRAHTPGNKGPQRRWVDLLSLGLTWRVRDVEERQEAEVPELWTI